MKKLILILMVACIVKNTKADITIVVKGTGGLISKGTTHTVCPSTSTATCATINMPMSIIGPINATLECPGLKKTIIFNSSLIIPNEGNISINGSDLTFYIID